MSSIHTKEPYTDLADSFHSTQQKSSFRVFRVFRVFRG